jgi:hypothetical protein
MVTATGHDGPRAFSRDATRRSAFPESAGQVFRRDRCRFPYLPGLRRNGQAATPGCVRPSAACPSALEAWVILAGDASRDGPRVGGIPSGLALPLDGLWHPPQHAAVGHPPESSGPPIPDGSRNWETVTVHPSHRSAHLSRSLDMPGLIGTVPAARAAARATLQMIGSRVNQQAVFEIEVGLGLGWLGLLVGHAHTRPTFCNHRHAERWPQCMLS